MFGSLDKATVVGDGGWGTSLAIILAAKFKSVSVWSHDPVYAEHTNRARRNTKFLPGVDLPGNIEFTGDCEAAMRGSELVMTVVPTKYARSVLSKLRECYTGVPVITAAKGIETGSLHTNSELVRLYWEPSKVGVLSGPSHAEEVARGLPATVVIAGEDSEFIKAAQAVLSSPSFRVYTNSDPIGVELCGAVKNVIAIAAGICDGLKLGDNAKSALLTRGIAEIARLIVAAGGKAETVSGLAGIGDLITTCISPFGRNRRVGMMLAEGKSLEEVVSSMEMVAEGVTTADAVVALARRHGVEMPICEEVRKVLFENKKPFEAVHDLMTRELKREDVSGG
ncbi:MAG: NAD(P)H-dependent glycerol-3-phosphate dehydrogenase [Planctomycetota bacterium]